MFRPLAAVVVLLAALGCPRPIQAPPEASALDDAALVACVTAEECGDAAAFDCIGVCRRKCTADEQCSASTYCGPRGHCEAGCRDDDGCGAGAHCVAGTCTSAAAACLSHCDCGVGQACVDGACQRPPLLCTTANDCPRGPRGEVDRCEAYLCDVFTHRCVDPDPAPCANNDECFGRPGCAEGCACNGAQQCVPSVACTVANEASTCGADRFCDVVGACAQLPACTSSVTCTPLGLACDVEAERCVRPPACTAPSSCTEAPLTQCDVVTRRCALPRCDNGGLRCAPDEVCGADGVCRAQGGAPCTSHGVCEDDELCSFASGAGACVKGCRGNAWCPAGQECGADAQCVSARGGGALLPAGSSCGVDGDCEEGLQCMAFLGVGPRSCVERCATLGASCAGGACCARTAKPWCSALGTCGDQPLF
jgi:hypothetical protein